MKPNRSEFSALAFARDALSDLRDPRTVPDPRDVLRAGEAVRQAREAATGLGLHVEDAAGAAVLQLAARMDTGSRIVRGEREKLAHCTALMLLLRTPRGGELFEEAGWLSTLVLRPQDHLAVTYSRFRRWLDSVFAGYRVGEVRGPRVGLALAAAKAIGATDVGNYRVGRQVSVHGRRMSIDADEVPGALLLAQEQGASADGLLRRTPRGLRWVERRARDLVEKVTPRRSPVDGTTPTEVDQADDAPGPVDLAAAADLLDKIAALGDATDRAILDGRRQDESDDAIGQRLGMSGRAVRKRLSLLRERSRRLIG